MHLDRIMSEIEREKGGRGKGVRETERDRSETERQKHGERDFGLDLVFCMSSIS